MSVDLFFASVNIGCADPAALAEFWAKVLGREITPGTLDGVMAVGTTDPGGRPQMIFHPAPEAERIIGGFVPTLLTDHHDEETGRLAGLGASLVSEEYQPPGSPSSCQAPVPLMSALMISGRRSPARNHQICPAHQLSRPRPGGVIRVHLHDTAARRAWASAPAW